MANIVPDPYISLWTFLFIGHDQAILQLYVNHSYVLIQLGHIHIKSSGYEYVKVCGMSGNRGSQDPV